ncbi:hypothetical protein MKX01_024947 [Papaver californicum]|nr:hypothetical protein MKX01_024947 [Papaver californicum]
MVSARTIDRIRTTVGIIGNIISFGLFASPAPTFYEIIKKGAVEEFSPNPYLCTILNCLLWVYYGLPFVHPNSILVVTINGVGLVIELVYICIFLMYATKKGRRSVLWKMAVEVVFYAAVVLLLTFVPVFVAHRPMIIGILCDIINILMYAMPLDNMRQVIETKSNEYLPKYLLFFNALNGGCWLAFALLRFDIYILVSNGLGFLLGLIQIILWFWYNNPKLKEDEVPKIDARKEISMV